MAKLHAAELAGGGVEIKSALVAGAAADTNMAVAGLSWKKDPRFIAIVHLSTAAAIATADMLTSEAQQGSTDSALQLSTTDTTSDQLLVIWAQKA